MRQQSWKLIGDQLFHLESDPGERFDRADDYSTNVDRLRRLLAEVPRGTAGDTLTLGDTLSDELRALGYLR